MHCCAFKALWMSLLQNFQLIFLHRSVLGSHHEQHCWHLQTIQHVHTGLATSMFTKWRKIWWTFSLILFAKSSGFLTNLCRWGWSDLSEIYASEGQRSVEEYTGINDVVGWKRWRFGLFFPLELKGSTPLAANCSLLRPFGYFEDNKLDF